MEIFVAFKSEVLCAVETVKGVNNKGSASLYGVGKVAASDLMLRS